MEKKETEEMIKKLQNYFNLKLVKDQAAKMEIATFFKDLLDLLKSV
jgi:hypothetical protein